MNQYVSSPLQAPDYLTARVDARERAISWRASAPKEGVPKLLLPAAIASVVAGLFGIWLGAEIDELWLALAGVGYLLGVGLSAWVSRGYSRYYELPLWQQGIAALPVALAAVAMAVLLLVFLLVALVIYGFIVIINGDGL